MYYVAKAEKIVKQKKSNFGEVVEWLTSTLEECYRYWDYCRWHQLFRDRGQVDQATIELWHFGYYTFK